MRRASIEPARRKKAICRHMFALTVRFTIKAGWERRFVERVTAQARASLEAEPHCRQFDVCCDGRTPRHLLLYEVYTTEADFEAHLATAHFLEFDEETREWVEQKRVERWDRVERI